MLFCISLLLFNLLSFDVPTYQDQQHRFATTLNEDITFFKIDIFAKKTEFLHPKEVLTTPSFSRVTAQPINSLEFSYYSYPDPSIRNPHRLVSVGSLSPPSIA